MANVLHLHPLPVPQHVELAERQRGAVDADDRDDALRVPPSDGDCGTQEGAAGDVPPARRRRLGWRLWIAVDGDPLRNLYFGETTLDPGIQSLFLARQFIGALPIFALGIAIRWLVLKGRLAWVNQMLPPQIAVWPILALLVPSIVMLRLGGAGLQLPEPRSLRDV